MNLDAEAQQSQAAHALLQILELVDQGELEATPAERAFVAGALGAASSVGHGE